MFLEYENPKAVGQIQPHGLLFALSEPDLTVRQASANFSALLGMPLEAVLGQSFEAVLGARQFELFQRHILRDDALGADPLRMRLGSSGLEVQCVAHRQDGVLIVELELLEGVQSCEPLNLNTHIRLPLSRLELAASALELSQAAASEVRRLSGFERVMVYRFDEEWNGEVIAEAVEPSSPLSYLGWRFPVDDIPLQAIVDVDAAPVPMVPESALDLTGSFLRSAAPVHLAYLRNLGVRSSLTISIVVKGQLWGLITCHHGAARQVDYSTRSVCELIGQMLGMQLALRIDDAAAQLRLASRSLLHNYMAEIDALHSLVYADYFDGPRLLELFEADGLVLHIDGVSSTHGHTVEAEALLPVVGKLRELSVGGIANSGGALYLGLAEESGDYVLLLRRERVETARGRSRPWSELELENALFLREQLLRVRETLAVLNIQRVSVFNAAQSTQRFRFLADTMPQLIWTAEPDGTLDYYNQRWIDYTGRPIEYWMESIHPDDLPNTVDCWARTLATGCDYEVEYRIKRGSDGVYHWHLGRAFPLRGDNNEVIQWVGTCTDIEDQKQALSKLESGVAKRTVELSAARQQLQTVLDGSTNVAMIATNTEGLITVFNSGAENMLGYRSEEIAGKQNTSLFHLESEVIARGLELTEETGRQVQGFDVFAERARKGLPDEREWTYVRRDGRHLTVNLVVTGLRDVSGNIIGFLGVAMDVSGRKKAEAAARASDQHFRLIVETVEDYALIMLDPGGHVISWNIGAERIKGYQAEEIIGRHFSCFYLPKEIERQHPNEELWIAAQRGRYAEEGWRVRKDGSRFLADIFIAPIRDDGGKLLGFAKVIHDITERKLNERQVVERSAQLEAANQQLNVVVRRLGLATDALQAGIWDWDVRSNAIEWDARMFEIYGQPRDSQIDYQTWASLVVPEDLAGAEAILQSVVATKSQGSAAFRIRLPNGSLRYIQAAEGAILGNAGEVVRVIGINIDTTDRKFNEDLERQVDERTAQLKAVNKELEEFAYVASHDLKAPLRVIDNASKWLEEDLQEHLTEETRENLNLMRGRVRRMDKLLDDLLAYARIGRATDNRFSETINGDTLMADIQAMLASANFTLRISPSFAGIQVYRMPLQQILMNLIGNAIKHHDKKTGIIEVTVEDDGDNYAFAVKDDGPGIPAQFHDQIFKMFQTLRPRDQVEGSGMGLAMVRKNVEFFGGVLQLESAEGQGSIFRFTWPKQQRLNREAA